MNGHDSNELFWDTLAGALIRAFFISAAFLAVWFLFLCLGGDWIYSMHARWFEITVPDFHRMWYMGMLLFKSGIILFFLIPYIAIRIALASQP